MSKQVLFCDFFSTIHPASLSLGSLALALQEGIRRHSLQEGNGSRIIDCYSPFRGWCKHGNQCGYKLT